MPAATDTMTLDLGDDLTIDLVRIPAGHFVMGDTTGEGDADVARVAEGIRQRLDQAEAHNEILLDGLDRQMEDALSSIEVEAQLEERRNRLGLE